MSSFYYALAGNERRPELDIETVEKINDYWDRQAVIPRLHERITSPQTDIYQTEMPGG